MRERDVLIAACGVSEDEEPKAQVLIKTLFVNLKNGAEIEVDSIHLHGPVINCFRNMERMSVDIQFDCASDPDLIQCIQVLQKFCIPENSLDNQSENVPIISVTILPVSLGGEYYVTGIHGSWVVMPSQANRLPDSIRFIFNNDDFHTYRNDASNMNIDEMLKELEISEE